MSERNYYVLCDSNCKFPAMTAEQVLAAIAEATGKTPTHVDDAFITKIREMNANANLKFWFGEEYEYNALVANGSIAADTVYCIKKDGVALIRTPIRGIDYWTEEDKSEIVADVVSNFINAAVVAL
jgi:hypothetical protein